MIPLQNQKHMIARLRADGIFSVIDDTPFPKPFYHDLSKVKAIYLGCDPTNTKYNHRFEYVFALPNGDNYHFGQFVRGQRSNLGEVGLSWETVYVQNLCQNYFRKETSRNAEDWNRAAKIWIDHLRSELAVLNKTIPVLLTSEVLYKVLLSENVPQRKASEFYSSPKNVPIPHEQNLLGRPLIPFYRHFAYALGKHSGYAKRVRAILDRKAVGG